LRISARRTPRLLDPTLHSSSQFTPREQDPAPAGLALYPNVGPEADHPPFKTAARMRLTQTNDIVHLKLD